MATGPWRASRLQRHWESQAFVSGGGNYAAPAQRVGDFLEGVLRPRWGCDPVLSSRCYADRSRHLPAGLCHRRDPRSATAFGRQIKGFDMDDARADRRGNPDIFAGTGAARRRFPEPQHQGPLSRRAKARAMRAEYFRLAWTASNWPKPWPAPSPAKGLEPAGIFLIAALAKPGSCHVLRQPGAYPASRLGYIKFRNYRPLGSGGCERAGARAADVTFAPWIGAVRRRRAL